ncbi:metal-dependent hydrolase [Luteimonas gilva]|uniref:Metal-dependent hydrolase n=1 Tax=Luteimonas gilva TaxID=2572684 RepID=A0A4U5JQE4_9GAMM|nr:metal-dependent hydrolase [Luteimonas gilva]TKR30668.1 metal-dependent hydrolase [Luteimonas gilva]
MSSVVGHAAAGVAAYLACNRLSDRQSLRAPPVFVFLAICPDLDYLAIWLFHAVPAPRITHSLLFGLTTAASAWLYAKSLRREHPLPTPFLGLLAASLSHPALDLLVGAHPVPLLWPLSDPDLSMPFGVLPSAGRLALGNYYLWRNLLIELVVLLPALAVIVAAARRVPFRAVAIPALAVAPIWWVFLAWSIGLHR